MITATNLLPADVDTDAQTNILYTSNASQEVERKNS